MKYAKIAKYISYALLILGVLVEIIGLAIGFDGNEGLVDVLLYFGYAMVAIALLGIIGLGIYAGAQINLRGLVRTIIVIVLAIIVVGVVYAVSPGNDPIAYNGAPQTHSMLKLTETILTLTYIFCAGAILSVVVGAIVNQVRK